MTLICAETVPSLVVDFDFERGPAADKAVDLRARDVGCDALREVPVARGVPSSAAVLDAHSHLRRRHDVSDQLGRSGKFWNG